MKTSLGYVNQAVFVLGLLMTVSKKGLQLFKLRKTKLESFQWKHKQQSKHSKSLYVIGMIPEKYQQPICHSLQSLWVGVVPTQTASKKRVKKTWEQLGFWGYTRYQLYAPFCGKWHRDIRKTTQLLSSIDRHPKTKTNGNTQSLLKRRSFPFSRTTNESAIFFSSKLC